VDKVFDTKKITVLITRRTDYYFATRSDLPTEIGWDRIPAYCLRICRNSNDISRSDDQEFALMISREHLGVFLGH